MCQKNFAFFFVPDTLRFTSLYLDFRFLRIYGSDFSEFRINRTTLSGSIISQNLRVENLLRRVISGKDSILGFFRGQRLYFQSCHYSTPRNVGMYELFDGRPFGRESCCDISFQKKWWVFVRKTNCLKPTFEIPECPLCLINLRRCFPSASRRSMWFLHSYIASIIIDWAWIIWQPKFFRRRVFVENNEFLRGQVVLCCTFLPQSAFYGITVVLKWWNMNH